MVLRVPLLFGMSFALANRKSDHDHDGDGNSPPRYTSAENYRHHLFFIFLKTIVSKNLGKKKKLIRRGSFRRLCRIRLGPAHIDWGDEMKYPFSYSLSKNNKMSMWAQHRRINDLGEWIFRNVGDCSVQL